MTKLFKNSQPADPVKDLLNRLLEPKSETNPKPSAPKIVGNYQLPVKVGRIGQSLDEGDKPWIVGTFIPGQYINEERAHDIHCLQRLIQNIIDDDIIDTTFILNTRRRWQANFYNFRGNYRSFIERPGHYLYIISNLVNGNIYIGCTKSLYHRLQTYTQDCLKIDENNIPIIKALIKYKFHNFSFDIIKRFSSENEMYNFENYLLDFLKNKFKFIKLYNVCPGGRSLAPINFKNGINTNRSLFKCQFEIEKIFHLYHIEKLSSRDIARKLKIKSPTTIKNLLNGKTYKEITCDLIKKFGKNKHDRKIFLGNDNGTAKLTEQQVLEIIHLYFETNFTIKKLSKKYKVAESTIDWILKGKNWKHITKSILENFKTHERSKLK